MNVCVYGTLKRGHANHRHLRGSTLLGQHRLDGWVMVSFGGCPAVFRGDGSISVEAYEITASTLSGLDYLEYGYVRGLVDTPWGQAWLYHIQAPLHQYPVITDGVWRKEHESYEGWADD